MISVRFADVLGHPNQIDSNFRAINRTVKTWMRCHTWKTEIEREREIEREGEKENKEEALRLQLNRMNKHSGIKWIERNAARNASPSTATATMIYISEHWARRLWAAHTPEPTDNSADAMLNTDGDDTQTDSVGWLVGWLVGVWCVLTPSRVRVAWAVILAEGDMRQLSGRLLQLSAIAAAGIRIGVAIGWGAATQCITWKICWYISIKTWEMCESLLRSGDGLGRWGRLVGASEERWWWLMILWGDVVNGMGSATWYA